LLRVSYQTGRTIILRTQEHDNDILNAYKNLYERNNYDIEILNIEAIYEKQIIKEVIRVRKSLWKH
jgi:hypothetical protein